jgi:hypothetical protein
LECRSALQFAKILKPDARLLLRQYCVCCEPHSVYFVVRSCLFWRNVRAVFIGASSLARKYGLSIGRGLDFCQSALSWQDSIHLSNSLPSSHPSRDRKNLWNPEQQGSTDRVAHVTSVAGDIADLKRGECEGRTVTASSYDPKDYAGALRTGGFSRSAGSPQEGRADGASIRIPREIEGAGSYRNGVETGVSLALGVRGCPKSALPKSAKYFEILVSAAGLEPATHALKGHCSTN